jgi:hypothetical protein
MAAVLFFVGGQSVGLVVPFLPLCTPRMTTDSVRDSHSSKVFIPNLAAFRGMYSLNESQPFQSKRDSSIVMFWPER